jgi:hypothetical protein
MAEEQPRGYYPKEYPTKDRSIALILEFFFRGIGWVYAGKTTEGFILLGCVVVWDIFAAILDTVTVGIFLCIHAPVSLTVMVVSMVMLNNYTKQHPNTFR